MAHLLRQLGAAALKPRIVAGKQLEPAISFEQAMKLREQFYMNGQCVNYTAPLPLPSPLLTLQPDLCLFLIRTWPYESIVPGPPQPPPGGEQYLERKKLKEEAKAKRLAGLEGQHSLFQWRALLVLACCLPRRQKEIQTALAKMPQLIAEYKVQYHHRQSWSLHARACQPNGAHPPHPAQPPLTAILLPW